MLQSKGPLYFGPYNKIHYRIDLAPAIVQRKKKVQIVQEIPEAVHACTS